jgi:hypothetical protein
MKMTMNIEIVEHYGTLDVEFGSECNTELIIDGEFQIGGDYYHNHISDRIEGFIEGLRFATDKEMIITTTKLADCEDWD